MAKCAFIGTGNMGSALVRAACESVGAGQVAVTNRTGAKAEALAAETGCRCYLTALEAVCEAEFVFLCVKPYQLREVVTGLAPALTGKVLVSVAAGVTLADLESWAGEVPVLRIMPNTPCAIGKGMTALCGGRLATGEHLAQVEAILAASGRVERVEERLFDAFSAVAGCGPAYVYQFIEALSDGGVNAGLPRAQAITYAAQMVLGAASMVLETGEHPGALKDAVCSPGGSTIEGVAALERGAFRGTVMDAVLAAWRRGMELGK